jgi:hypothetical protein
MPADNLTALQEVLKPRLGGVAQVDAMIRLGQVIDTAGLADVPPTLLIGNAEINVQMRVAGDVWSYHPGDTVVWTQRADVPLVLGVLPSIGTESDFEHEDFTPWHEIGDAGEPAFQNSWVNFGSGFETAGYWKQSDGWVRLKGVIKNGTTGSLVIVFSLPTGYRPPRSMYFTTQSTDGTAAIRVDQAGEVRIITTPGNTYVSLCGITFPSSMNFTSDAGTIHHRGRWNAPSLGSGWARANVGSSETTFFTRSDGWVWVTGAIDASSAPPGNAFSMPDDAAAGWRCHMCCGLGLGLSRSSIGGGDPGTGRGPRIWRVETGSTGVIYIGGINYFGQRSCTTSDHAPGTGVSFENSWVNWGADFQDVKYKKDAHGIVHVWGLADGSAASATTIFTLPVGYRPLGRHIFNSVRTGNGQGRIDVLADGQVVAQGFALNGFTSLTGVTFRAMQ